MRGVGFVRATFRPEAQCTGCPWAAQSTSTYPAVRLRSHAQQHVQETGHHVTVEIIDRTSYYPYPEVAS